MRSDELIAIALVGILVVLVALFGYMAELDKAKQNDVAWVGCLPSGGAEGNVGILVGHEIGLRADGVVVWRKK